jgi:hypothetical protein
MIRVIAFASRPLRAPSVYVGWVANVVGTVVAFGRARLPKFDNYQPELHYMRGPGPKWREKHPDAD